MRHIAEPGAPVAIVCGSDSLIGDALVSRLHQARWRVMTIDPPGTAEHHVPEITLQGPLEKAATWRALRERLRGDGLSPRAFIHAVSGFAESYGPGGADSRSPATRSRDLVAGARLGCEHIMPLMAGPDAAIVLVASVLAYWDTRAGMASYSASQAGLLALTRSLALAGGAEGIRANAVAAGMVAGDRDGSAPLPADVTGRIPLGRPASSADIVDAIIFLISADAAHITGSTLVVDGGQSLQSWSNAPREGHYPQLVPPANPQPLPPSQEGATSRVPGSAETGEFFALASRPSDEHRGREEGSQRFHDRVVLITGAGGGLGSAAARRFAGEGAMLALLDRDASAVAELARQLAPEGRSALVLEADVADERSIAAAIAAAESHFGRIDVLFNNAGVGSRDVSLVDTPADHWDEVLAINLRGVFLCCKYGVPPLIRAGGGAIVNMGSSTGRHDTITGGAAYMASKAAVEALTKSLALQVAPFDIRANTICPGIIQTRLSFRQQERGDEVSFFAEFADRIPLGRVGQPEDVAAAVAFLASDQSRHITGAALLIDGGQTLRRWISAPDLVPPAQGVLD